MSIRWREKCFMLVGKTRMSQSADGNIQSGLPERHSQKVNINFLLFICSISSYYFYVLHLLLKIILLFRVDIPHDIHYC